MKEFAENIIKEFGLTNFCYLTGRSFPMGHKAIIEQTTTNATNSLRQIDYIIRKGWMTEQVKEKSLHYAAFILTGNCHAGSFSKADLPMLEEVYKDARGKTYKDEVLSYLTTPDYKITLPSIKKNPMLKAVNTICRKAKEREINEKVYDTYLSLCAKIGSNALCRVVLEREKDFLNRIEERKFTNKLAILMGMLDALPERHLKEMVQEHESKAETIISLLFAFKINPQNSDFVSFVLDSIEHKVYKPKGLFLKFGRGQEEFVSNETYDRIILAICEYVVADKWENTLPASDIYAASKKSGKTLKEAAEELFPAIRVSYEKDEKSTITHGNLIHYVSRNRAEIQVAIDKGISVDFVKKLTGIKDREAPHLKKKSVPA